MSRCSSSSCLNGNCEGCKNGVKFCNDPRCFPDCPDCEDEKKKVCVTKRDGIDWTLIIIIGILALLLLILLVVMCWPGSDSCCDNHTNNDHNNTDGILLAEPPVPQVAKAPPVHKNIEITHTNPVPVPRNRMRSPLFQELDTSLDVPDMNMAPVRRNVTLTDSINILPKVPRVSLESPTNASVASAKSVPANKMNVGPSLRNVYSREEIKGF
jgi:hypothetical protein